jgi:hypothetical protein
LRIITGNTDARFGRLPRPWKHILM